MAGGFGTLLGALAVWVGVRGLRLPRFLGWGVIAITLVGGSLVPYSPGWLLGVAGVLVLLDRR